jgi:hypothetical protein
MGMKEIDQELLSRIVASAMIDAEGPEAFAMYMTGFYTALVLVDRHPEILQKVITTLDNLPGQPLSDGSKEETEAIVDFIALGREDRKSFKLHIDKGTEM